MIRDPFDKTLRCADCWYPIMDDDDACVCIQCGGRNRRAIIHSEIENPASWSGPPIIRRTTKYTLLALTAALLGFAALYFITGG